MFKLLALSLLMFLSPPALAGKHAEKNRAPASLAKCRDAKCPMNMIHCEQGTHRVDVRPKGACCPKWKCEGNEGVDENECKNAKCPMLSPPRCRDDEMIKSDGIGCCPKPICVPREEGRDCRMAKCPKRFVQCQPGEKKVDRREQGACCPKFKCEKGGTRDVVADACPAIAPPKCDDTQILINKAAEGECPDWECMDDESEEL